MIHQSNVLIRPLLLEIEVGPRLALAPEIESQPKGLMYLGILIRLRIRIPRLQRKESLAVSFMPYFLVSLSRPDLLCLKETFSEFFLVCYGTGGMGHNFRPAALMASSVWKKSNEAVEWTTSLAQLGRFPKNGAVPTGWQWSQSSDRPGSRPVTEACLETFFLIKTVLRLPMPFHTREYSTQEWHGPLTPIPVGGPPLHSLIKEPQMLCAQDPRWWYKSSPRGFPRSVP